MLTAQLKPARVSQGVVLSHVHVQLLRLRGMRPRIVIKETRGKLGEQGGYVRFSGGQTEPAEACHYFILSESDRPRRARFEYEISCSN